VVALAPYAAPAHAELAFFANGRTLSIKGHRLERRAAGTVAGPEDGDEDVLVLSLRGGGEMTVDPSIITHITPDEVPYPEPEATSAKWDAAAGDGNGRARPDVAAYAGIIDRVSKEQGVDAKLVRAVIQVESAYQQSARSRKGAMGLMQLMPETARQYAVADPYDPASNIEAGIKHLKALLDRWPRELALAAYNAGEAAVERFRGIPPYPETRAYVDRILQLVGR
jgi:soluble lytic murein transglycosylase-like protein